MHLGDFFGILLSAGKKRQKHLAKIDQLFF